MSGIIEIDDMPVLGAVTDTSLLVGEKAGSGVFSGTALRDYTNSSVWAGGTFTGPISAPQVSAGDVHATGDVTAANIASSGNVTAVDVHATGDVTAANIASSGDITAIDVNATGAVTGNVLAATANVTAVDVNATGGITAANIASSGDLTYGTVCKDATNLIGLVNDVAGNRRYVEFGGPGYAWMFNTTNASMSWVASGTTTAVFGAAGDMTLSVGEAYKTAGGPWAAISDARIKTVVGDYVLGLEELLQLQPVSYRYRPDCGIADTDSIHVGMLAQDVQSVLPGMVHTTKGIVNGAAVSDLLALNTNEMQYAMLNAIKEMDARIKALEGVAT